MPMEVPCCWFVFLFLVMPVVIWLIQKVTKS